MDISIPDDPQFNKYYTKYYPDSNGFKSSISDCLNKTHIEYKEELRSLLTLNFQTFEKEQMIDL